MVLIHAFNSAKQIENLSQRRDSDGGQMNGVDFTLSIIFLFVQLTLAVLLWVGAIMLARMCNNEVWGMGSWVALFFPELYLVYFLAQKVVFNQPDFCPTVSYKRSEKKRSRSRY
jgi:hypothetical protein